MATGKTSKIPMARWAGRAAVAVIFAAGVVVLLLWLAGKFTPKVAAGLATQPVETWSGRTAEVRSVALPLTESAVGTIRAVHETSIASKILARVVEVKLKAGQAVKAGEMLVRLDDADLQARLQQAKAAVAAAEAAHTQAVIDEARMARMLKSNSASQQEYDRANTALKAAAAELTRTRESVNEAQAMLGWATVSAPIDGIVIDKKIDVGDTATPGQALLTLYDPTRMQLVASVRESLAHQLQAGQAIGVQIDALKKLCDGTVSEIVPEAQSASRSFQVKVTGPCPPGIYSGMFGRIIIPLEQEQVLVIPRQTVRNVGQLELVDVVKDGRASRRAVRTGRTLGDDLEVLSGLSAGEQVAVPAAQEASRG